MGIVAWEGISSKTEAHRSTKKSEDYTETGSEFCRFGNGKPVFARD